MLLSDFFRIFISYNEHIVKILKLANEMTAINATSFKSNMDAIFETTGLFQKIEYWAKETARLKTRVNVLIDQKDDIESEMAALKVEKFLLENNYKNLSDATKMLRIAFKSVNDVNDRLRMELKKAGK